MGIKYTSLTKKAMMICFETHKNQKDKSGMPYVFSSISSGRTDGDRG